MLEKLACPKWCTLLVIENQFLDLLFPGGTVHIVCRNKDKAEEARTDIVNESGNTVSVGKIK